MKIDIICTIGPASWSDEMIIKMIHAGMSVARINASFADHTEIKRIMNLVKSVNPDVEVMLDLMGNKIRIAKLQESKEIKNGEIVIIECDPLNDDQDKLHITYENLYTDIKLDAPILIEDGRIRLKVTKIEGTHIYTEVIIGGLVKNGKTLNVPGTNLTFDTLTTKDTADLKVGIEINVDKIAVSFVRNALDIEHVKSFLNGRDIKIISKIENPQGVENFDEILNISEGIMVARGDLGVEMPLESIPILQKQFIKKANAHNKYIIVATEMISSMVENATPTRAEVSDIANAVMDGANALMLSAESSVGKYPVESIEYMKKIIEYTANADK